jgi:hypothetical protein
LYRTRLQELWCIFPANVDPRITCSNWRAAWKNCSSAESSSVQIVPPTEPCCCWARRREVQSTGAGLGWGWRGWSDLGGHWPSIWRSRSRSWGGTTPKCGESDRPRGQRGQNFHQWDTTVATDALAVLLKSSNLSLLRLFYTVLRRRSRGH